MRDIDARDGEADEVDCGAGQDTVKADPVDTVAANCETVEGPASQPDTKPAAKTCTVPKVVGLKVRTAKRRIAKAGCKAVLRGSGRKVVRQSIRHGRRKPAVHRGPPQARPLNPRGAHEMAITSTMTEPRTITNGGGERLTFLGVHEDERGPYAKRFNGKSSRSEGFGKNDSDEAGRQGPAKKAAGKK